MVADQGDMNLGIDTKKYRRGQQNKLKGLADKKHKAKLKRTEELYENVSMCTEQITSRQPDSSSNLIATGAC